MRCQAKPWIYLMTAFLLVLAPACKSGSASSDTTKSSEAAGGHTIDVMCIGDRINNPPEAFHYSYKYTDAKGSVNKEADITPQAMDIAIADKSGSHSYHGVHSDEASWNAAVLDLSNLNVTVMSARLGSITDGSAVSQQGAESVNGYSTTRYAIDTASAKASDQERFEALFGKGAFEKGTVWVPADGCAVKLILDEGVVQPNLSVNKAHYEMLVIKK